MAETIDLRKKKKRRVATAPAPASRKSTHLDDTAVGQPRFVFDYSPVSWEGPLYYMHGTKRVAIIATVVMLALAIGAFFLNAGIITVVLFVLLGGMVLLNANKQPPPAHFTVTPTEVIVNDTTYRYEDIKSFWIDYIPGLDVHELSLQLSSWYKPYVKIPLQALDPVQIREILIEFILEEEHKETIGDVLTKKIGL